MIMQIFLLIIGLMVLSVAADMLIEAVIKIAEKFKISKLVISLSLVALGTSIPETVVSIMSAIRKSPIAFSNVVGSNIANIALIVGCSLMIGNIYLTKKMKLEINKMVLINVLLFVLCICGFSLGKIHGAIMIFCLGLYIYSLYTITKQEKDEEEKEVEDTEEWIAKIGRILFKNEWVMIIMYTLLGFIGLIGGGELVVNNAINIASALNINEGIIGATIIAIGTSLPELMTSISAMRKKHYDIIIGNIVGSCIINILLILGISSILVDIQLQLFEMIGVGLMFLVTITFYFMTKPKEKLTILNGIILIALYIIATVIISRLK